MWCRPARARLATQGLRVVPPIRHLSSAPSWIGTSPAPSASNDLAPLPSNATVFSGIQPTGVPHLGNYLGALRQWVRLQNSAPQGTRLLFSIVDLHALTVPQPPEELKQRRREMLAMLLAIGLDPKRCTIFYQSAVPAHSELMWILSCTSSMGYLGRMTQWKSKIQVQETAQVTDKSVQARLKLGLFSYPVLQAADVILHRTTHVPVGGDQKQHLEFARECVTNFNHAYKAELFPPETLLSPALRIKSLTNPTSKMSKSDANTRSRILLSDKPQEIRSKISKALTDSIQGVSYDPEGRPGVSNLLEILSAFDKEGRDAAALGADFESTGASPADLKRQTADAVVAGLGDIHARYCEIMGQNGSTYLESVAQEGGSKARGSAAETMRYVRDRVGL